MDQQQLQQRVEMLKGRFVFPEYVRDYYGLDSLEAYDLLNEDLDRFQRTMVPSPKNDAAFVDRYALEGFFRARRLTITAVSASSFIRPCKKHSRFPTKKWRRAQSGARRTRPFARRAWETSPPVSQSILIA